MGCAQRYHTSRRLQRLVGFDVIYCLPGRCPMRPRLLQLQLRGSASWQQLRRARAPAKKQRIPGFVGAAFCGRLCSLLCTCIHLARGRDRCTGKMKASHTQLVAVRPAAAVAAAAAEMLQRRLARSRTASLVGASDLTLGTLTAAQQAWRAPSPLMQGHGHGGAGRHCRGRTTGIR